MVGLLPTFGPECRLG